MKKGVRDLQMRKTLKGELAIRSKLEPSRKKKLIVNGTKPRRISHETELKLMNPTLLPKCMTDALLVSWTAKTNAGKGNLSSVYLFTTLRVLLSKLYIKVVVTSFPGRDPTAHRLKYSFSVGLNDIGNINPGKCSEEDISNTLS